MAELKDIGSMGSEATAKKNYATQAMIEANLSCQAFNISFFFTR
jgi:hypothetical protein